MRCAQHQMIPLATAPFQTARGAAWLMHYCQRCGERTWLVRSPYPITVDQPEAQ